MYCMCYNDLDNLNLGEYNDSQPVGCFGAVRSSPTFVCLS